MLSVLLAPYKNIIFRDSILVEKAIGINPLLERLELSERCSILVKY
jgi:hypothetical protein